MRKVLYIVIPCFNEEAVLKNTIKITTDKINQLIRNKMISKDSKVLLVSDGSTDHTWNIILHEAKNNHLITGISLANNVGHQNALLAGLFEANKYADFIISMDADGQDDINAIDEMIEKYNSGAEIVYGVRQKRDKDTIFKRFTAKSFYKIMNILGAKTIYNHADFRLTSKKIINNLANYSERNMFLRGIFPLIGFKSETVYYDRNKRLAGKSKYSFKKMVSFALDGITSFSIKPIEFVLKLGILISLISLGFIIYSLIIKLLGRAVDGWTFIICSIWLLGGIQMFAIGLIGEYIGKIYFEVKRRPRYIIEENLLDKGIDHEKNI